MALENDIRSASIRAHAVNQHFELLKGEVFNILNGEATYIETISRLETELDVYKRAYADVDAERRHLATIQSEADRQREVLENQLKGHRVVTLIDGDGAIFTSELISQGAAGGHIAAQKLSDSIFQYISESNSGAAHQYQIWVYVFYNKRGLTETFGRLGHATLKAKFDDFAMGFNQATERFLMVDVGNGKEAADAKIKAHLEDDIRLPQTSKILFAGCHDNGYVTTLRSQITAGYKQKLVLLKSYSDMAKLAVPASAVPPGLSKPVGLSKSRRSSSVVRPTLPPLPPSPPLDPVPGPMKTPSLEANNVLGGSTTAEPEAIVVKRPAYSPPTYSFALKNSDHRPTTPELDAAGSSGSSDSGDSDDMLESIVSKSFTSRSSSARRIDASLPLSKQKPPPCTLFYLAQCKHGADCKYAHDYILEAEHYKDIRANAKKAPCPFVNRGEVCTWDEACCYGHTCPSLGNCYFLKKNKCKFVGVDMHKESKVTSNE